MTGNRWKMRERLKKSDREGIRRIVASTGFFSRAEVALALELVDERLSKGAASGFHFLVAENKDGLVGYTCFGPIPATKHSYDLYWIATEDSYRGTGIGKMLMSRTEELIAGRGGINVYIETSGRAQYRPTRAFYKACSYRKTAHLKDFYAPGDDKLIYVKVL
jgi:D-alanine-D-alanine ligase